eukprot:SRR837773.4392.p1 GENE.SRR837773.4392~~SRR837773.4392.p1  ORF type:complete len:266 (-),score=100.96 SRR837773.4392:125-856(-)
MGQVFQIPIPAGMPAGMTQTVQLPLGLPPGSTIVVTAQQQLPPATGGSSPTRTMVTMHMPVGACGSSAAGAPPGVLTPASAAAMGVTMDAGGHILPQNVLRSTTKSGALRIHYVVDARKLKANDKAVISPPFEISPANPGHYRIIVNPSFVKARGGATFKNSGGMGNVQLKCEDRSEGNITFTISIGDGRPGSMRTELARGPIEHSFADSSVCGLPKAQEEWDFNKVVDAASKTFSVFLDIAQ